MFHIVQTHGYLRGVQLYGIYLFGKLAVCPNTNYIMLLTCPQNFVECWLGQKGNRMEEERSWSAQGSAISQRGVYMHMLLALFCCIHTRFGYRMLKQTFTRIACYGTFYYISFCYHFASVQALVALLTFCTCEIMVF